MAKGKREFFCRSADGSITYTTDGNFLFAESAGGEVRLDIFAGHYYKLRPYNGVPILEVDGLRMQLVRDFETPLDYSKEVVKGLGIPREGQFTVLDTCMGLGYTAIAASKSPAVRLVVTCEVSEAVITLAQWNPFSEKLFAKDGNILVMKGSAAELIKGFEDNMFSFVIHDPPRITHAPELYSPAFYKELYRACKRGARIFHYVGSVGKGKGRRIDREVGKRLADAGFASIRYVPRLQGLYAKKH
ncbi:SAM-dependent methyltransferase [Candidatus Micrarchaeota archaeon]|nr:SAM-dependent methyltransferase [Candidatus Micrarchaeota archaeon]